MATLLLEKEEAAGIYQLAVADRKETLLVAEEKKNAIARERENGRKAAEGRIQKYEKQKQYFSKVLEQVKEHGTELLDLKQCLSESMLKWKDLECWERVAMAEKRRDDTLERTHLNRKVVFLDWKIDLILLKNLFPISKLLFMNL